MTLRLNVFLYEHHVGELIQNDSGEMIFSYLESWVNHPQAVRLSYSLPLRVEPFRRNECKGFFSGLLAEQEKRSIIAKNLGISERNDFSMLEKIGGECAGAVTFLPPGTELPAASSTYRKLKESELAQILRELPNRPLMAGETGVRLSLAGAQGKLPVAYGVEGTKLPLESTPSSHIIKPPNPRFPDLVYNEAFCMRLAEAIKIPTAHAEVMCAEDIDYLLVTRYDRVLDKQGIWHKIHQEDFCQAFNISPDHKYQSEGGLSIRQSFDLVRTVSALPVVDIQYLLEAVIFNYIIGNCDAHGKNFSLLYQRGLAGCRLTPLYDLLSTIYYADHTTHMAMKIGETYDVTKVIRRDFEKMAEMVGLSVPLVRERVGSVSERVARAIPVVMESMKNSEKIAHMIEQRNKEIFSRFN